MCKDMELRVNIVHLKNRQKIKRAGALQVGNKAGEVENGSC